MAGPDPSPIELIVEAHRLHEKLMTENLGIGDIAESEGVHHSYVSRLPLEWRAQKQALDFS